MKNLKSLLLLISCTLATLVHTQNNGIRFPENENFITRIHLDWADPNPSDSQSNFITDGALNYALEAGYSGKLYVLLGFEKFSKLQGGVVHGKTLNGYTSFNGAIGINLTHGLWEQWQYSTGIRLVRAYRGPITEDYKRHFIGWEAAITHQFINGVGVGFRATLDNRLDQEFFGWTPQHTFSGFFTITYKLFKITP